jgi:hypothetical protein
MKLLYYKPLPNGFQTPLAKLDKEIFMPPFVLENIYKSFTP